MFCGFGVGVIDILEVGTEGFLDVLPQIIWNIGDMDRLSEFLWEVLNIHFVYLKLRELFDCASPRPKVLES
jgi:hypothetical protein